MYKKTGFGKPNGNAYKKEGRTSLLKGLNIRMEIGSKHHFLGISSPYYV
jgi:hypothetical protein